MTETLVTPHDYPVFRNHACPFEEPAIYEQLRTDEPVSRVRLYDGREAWLFTRFEDVRTVLSHPEISAATLRPDFPYLFPSDRLGKGEQNFQRKDDPEHADRRHIFTPYFTMRWIEQYRPAVRQRVSDLIDALLEAGAPTDFVEHFALPLPSSVACELLGVPYEDHEFFESRLGRGVAGHFDTEQIGIGMREMWDYLDGLLRSKYDSTGDDILSRLVVEHVQTGELSHDDAVRDARLLLLAGFETTMNQIALSLIILLEHPDQLAKIQADKSLIPGAVEELLRYGSIAQLMGVRVAKSDLEIAGQQIKAGDGLIAPVFSANRDENAFPNAEVFDVTRKARHHLTFGFGVHQCLGQPLARMEIQEVLSVLFDRIPTIRLAIPLEEVSFKWESFFFGPSELPATW